MSDRVKVTVGKELRTDVEVRGHRIVADEPEAKGGTDEGPTPGEIFLSGLAACTAMTLRMYANLKELSVEKIEVEAEQTRVPRAEVDEPPDGVERDDYPKITMKIRVTGDLEEKMRERLHYIARRCPVHRVVTENPIVTHEFV